MNIIKNFKNVSLKVLVLSMLLTTAFSSGITNVSHVSAADCDANAVVWCGVTSSSDAIKNYTTGDGHNTAKSIQNIYTYFGITKAGIATAVGGTVTKDGKVFVNGNSTPVATGAITAGRQNMAGSTQVTYGGTTFYTRPTSVSFRSSSLAALVIMQDGVFKSAIIDSCGNPVKATPTPKPAPKPVAKPAYNINKLVAVKDTTSFAKTVTVKSGTHVIYRVTVNSTGNAAVQNLVVKDVLPANVTYVAGTLTRDGKALPSTASGQFFAAGYTVTSLAAGSSTTFQYEAIIGASDVAARCVVQTLTNTGSMTATTLPAQSSTADVSKTCVTPPATTTTPPAPTEKPVVLANTGAGSTIALFLGATSAAAIAYQFVLRRRTQFNS